MFVISRPTHRQERNAGCSLWGQVSNSLTLIRTSSPGSTVFALGIAKTCLRLTQQPASKVVRLLIENPLVLVPEDFLLLLCVYLTKLEPLL